MLFRTLATIISVFVILFAPWWISAPLLLIPLFYFNWYVEGVIIAFMYDVLFSVEVSYLYSFELLATAYTTTLLVLFYLLKKNLFWTQEW